MLLKLWCKGKNFYDKGQGINAEPLTIVKNELTKDVSKTMSLFDMGLSYRKKAMKISFDIRNILNQRQYAYTIYNSVNTFTYNYLLRGRECVCTVKLTM